jgi:signal transduction histidine kinase
MAQARPRLFRRFGLPEQILLVLLLVVMIDFTLNTLVFERENTFQLRRDDADRIAENLVLASRSMARTEVAERPAVAAALSTRNFRLKWMPGAARPRDRQGSANLYNQVIASAPELIRADLELYLASVPARDEVEGSMRLADNSILVFSTHAGLAWSLTAGRLFSMTAPSLLLLTIAWLLLHRTLRPLRSLLDATRQSGTGPPSPVAERGPEQIRELIAAFNAMRERTHRARTERTNSFLAIGHDLKTPLARIQLRLEDESLDPAVREGAAQDIEEMRMLLESIQAFVDSRGQAIPPERIDVAIMAETLVDAAADRGAEACYVGENNVELIARPVAIRRALSNLIENALHYGGNARVSVRRAEDHVEITVEDDGPGIPADRIAEALQPFVRLDSARERNTAGMGLGLAIVEKAVKAEGGTFVLRNRASGGLCALIRLPAPA